MGMQKNNTMQNSLGNSFLVYKKNASQITVFQIASFCICTKGKPR